MTAPAPAPEAAPAPPPPPVHRVYLRRKQAVSLSTSTELEPVARYAFWTLLHLAEAEDADVAWTIDRKQFQFSRHEVRALDRERLADFRPAPLA